MENRRYIPVQESDIKIPWIKRLAFMNLNKDSMKAFMDDLFEECKAAPKAKNESLIDTFSRVIINPLLESNLVPTQNLIDRLNYLNKRLRTIYTENLFFYMIDQAAFAAANAKRAEPLTREEAEHGPHTDFLVARSELGRLILDNCEHRLNTLEDIPVEATPREVMMTAIFKIEGIGNELKKKGNKVDSQRILELAITTKATCNEFFKKPMITPADAKLFHDDIKEHCDFVTAAIPKEKLPQWKEAVNTLLKGAAAAAYFGMSLIGVEFAKKHAVKPTLFSNESEGHKQTRALKSAVKTVLPKSKRPNSPS